MQRLYRLDLVGGVAVWVFTGWSDITELASTVLVGGVAVWIFTGWSDISFLFGFIGTEDSILYIS
jgi:hypothetical protein